jgi:hypothetical protein
MVQMADRGERSNYLTLALQARSAIKRLDRLAPGTEPTAELKSALQATLNSLGSNKAQEPLCSKLYSEVGFNRFEEIRTVEEVLQALNDPNLRTAIEHILSGKNYSERDIQDTLRFFSAVENRALYHYDDPSLAESFR